MESSTSAAGTSPARLTGVHDPRAYPRPRLRMARMALVRDDVAAAVASLADDLLHPPGSAAAGTALDHHRQRLHADVALVWACCGARATRMLSAGSAADAFASIVTSPTIVAVGAMAMMLLSSMLPSVWPGGLMNNGE